MALQGRAIVMVWDGMRPDLIGADLTPNLWALGERGVRFNDSHAMFPTVTRCNSATIGTGALPSRHGIPNNTFFLPAAEPARALNTGDDADLAKLRAVRDGRILTTQTLAERVHAAGGRTVVVGTGSPGSSLLLHPQAEECGDHIINPALFVGTSRKEIERRFGQFPERELPRTALNSYFTGMIADMVLPELTPDLLYFWHTDPDATVHSRGIGHPDSLAAIRDADTNLGRILGRLDALGLAGETNVIVTSDHGFSTVRGKVGAVEALIEAGLKQSKASLDVVVTSGYVYVRDQEPRTIETIARCLMSLEGVGSVLTGARGEPLSGTLPMSAAGAASAIAPDVIYSPAWTDEANEFGLPGHVAGDGPYAANHGSLSRWEVHNTLVAAGPGFREGLLSDTPAGNIDIGPTVASLLGLDLPDADGRVLSEALRGAAPPAAVERETLRASAGGFAQELRLARVAAAQYVDFARRL